jgi:hypothetical protein
MVRSLSFLAAVALSALAIIPAHAADAVKVRRILRQRVGDTIYFRVQLDRPADLRLPRIEPGPYSEGQRRLLARLPQLVPQDGNTFAVYQRLELPHFRPKVGFSADRPALVPIKGLEFVGKLKGTSKAKFFLLYPTGEEGAAPAGVKKMNGLARLVRRATWAELPLEVDFSHAAIGEARLPVKGRLARPFDGNDLEGLWAEAQAARLAVLEAQAPEFGFYGFACAATGRKYHVADPVLEGQRPMDGEKIHRKLFELTTGTTAITQSLALSRLRGADYRDRGPRTVDVAKVPGIAIAEHPWKKMMGDKRPAPEPLARLVPHDNYYLYFRDIRKLIELGEFLDQWGTTASRAYELQSRDSQIKQRYERQLCLRSTWMAKTLGPLVVRGVAITGNDPYLREGSDVTVIFHVSNRAAFLGAVEQFLREARKEHGSRLKESKEKFRGIVVERFVTPLREVSLNRAAFGDFVVYSNSPAGLRRVLDVHAGKLKSLADSLDFQYMRTCFVAGDKAEDAFGFLPDAFIRQLVGPVSKIKEMRRLEALTSLAMVTHGAMFTAWETGKLPADTKSLLTAACLRREYIYVPEGKAITWDAGQQTAVSDVYNTLHFATPLIELPLDKITRGEEGAYLKFRKEYLELWRRYFDPVGLRFSLSKKQVRAEVYVLPLINSPEYQGLRNMAGRGPITFDLAKISPHALLQLTSESYLDGLFFLRVEDSPALSRLAELWVRQDLNPGPERSEFERQLAFAARCVALRLPITLGIARGNQKDLTEYVDAIRKDAQAYLGPCHTSSRSYRGIRITKVTFGADSVLVREMADAEHINVKVSSVSFYHATIGNGWYLSLRKDSIRDEIDRYLAHKAGKGPAKGETIKINSSLYISPQAAVKAGGALRGYLEWESHKRALPNNALWYALYRCGLIAPDTPEPTRRAAAMRFLGFVPVSPDDAAYRFDKRTGEVVNLRHGSLRRPILHADPAAGSPLAGMLEQFPSLRADLRFREDGLHAVLTINRKTGK